MMMMMNHSTVKINKNTRKSPEDMRILAVTQTSLKTGAKKNLEKKEDLTLVLKLLKFIATINFFSYFCKEKQKNDR